jgi:F-type H+-transporting ATPase subunit a
MFFLSSPLEQFQILPIIPINIGIFDFSITNASIILAIGLGSFVFVLYSLLSEEGNFYIVPNRIQYIIEVIYSVVYGLLNDNVGSIGKSFFPYVFTLFTFVLISFSGSIIVFLYL